MSEIAKSGFRYEDYVAKEFKNWKTSKDAKGWLNDMGVDISKIQEIKAITTRAFSDTGKSDVYVFINKSKEPEGITIKYFQENVGYNQIDKRWIDHYKPLWNFSDKVAKALKKYTGEKGFQPKDLLNENDITKLKDERRFYIDELPASDQKAIKDFFSSNLHNIVSDMLKGENDKFTNWLLVTKHREHVFVASKLISIHKAINHYCQGGYAVSKRGVPKIGKITMQRKGGDAGKPTAQMLQFKFEPNEVFSIKE